MGSGLDSMLTVLAIIGCGSSPVVLLVYCWCIAGAVSVPGDPRTGEMFKLLDTALIADAPANSVGAVSI